MRIPFLSILGAEECRYGIYSMDGKLFAASTPLDAAAEADRFGEIRFSN